MKLPHDVQLARSVCAGCGCLCDDIEVNFRGDKLLGLQKACPLGEEWLRGLGPIQPEALVKGRPVNVADALFAMAKILHSASSPLLVGLSELTIEGLCEAARLAEASGAILIQWPEPPAGLSLSGLHAPECSATLGEVRGTADLVVFWRADPLRTHPRHLERFSLVPTLLRGQRVMVVVDANRENSTAQEAVETLPLSSQAPAVAEDIEIVRALRLRIERPDTRKQQGPPPEIAQRLLERIRASRHAHFFLGEDAARSPAFWDELQSLAAHAREKHRITISALPAPGNGRGVVEVMTWQLGSQELAMKGDLLSAGATDLVFALGMSGDVLSKSPFVKLNLPRITLASSLDPGAEASIRVPGLDPRLSATVVRSDGIHLSLDGRGGGAADPAVEILRQITRATGKQTRSSPSEPPSPTSWA